MFGWLKKWFNRPARETQQSGATAAHPDGEKAPRYHRNKRALKDWHTSHWDLDYMPREEMEALARKNRDDRKDQDD